MGLAKIEAAADWSPAEFSELRARIELDERVGDLLAEARRANRRAEKLEERLKRARSANAGQATSADTMREFRAAATVQLRRVAGKVRRVVAGWRGVPPPPPPRKKKPAKKLAKGNSAANAARRRKAAS